jgi:diadenosine tetraphosphate (Ap4A) HIT family hydrolase
MSTIIHQKVEACRQGTYPRLIKKMKSGFWIAGETQPVLGYCLLLPDPVVPSLNHMEKKHRELFLNEMAEIGDLLLQATQALRLNYEMLGNVAPALHAHLLPRYENEGQKLFSSVFCVYDFAKCPSFNPDMPWYIKIKSLC